MNNHKEKCQCLKCKCLRKETKGKHNPAYIDGRTNKKYFCVDCDKQLGQTAYQGTIRCRKCASIGKNNGNYKQGKPNCIDCGKKLSNYNNKRCKKCSKQGILSPFYIHGRGYEPYNKEFIMIRIKIRQRDNYKCQVCNKEAIDIHHIDYDKTNNRKNNLITLCEKCNINANHNRNYWYSYFTYIMEERKDEK